MTLKIVQSARFMNLFMLSMEMYEIPNEVKTLQYDEDACSIMMMLSLRKTAGPLIHFSVLSSKSVPTVNDTL